MKRGPHSNRPVARRDRKARPTYVQLMNALAKTQGRMRKALAQRENLGFVYHATRERRLIAFLRAFPFSEGSPLDVGAV